MNNAVAIPTDFTIQRTLRLVWFSVFAVIVLFLIVGIAYTLGYGKAFNYNFLSETSFGNIIINGFEALKQRPIYFFGIFIFAAIFVLLASVFSLIVFKSHERIRLILTNQIFLTFVLFVLIAALVFLYGYTAGSSRSERDLNQYHVAFSGDTSRIPHMSGGAIIDTNDNNQLLQYTGFILQVSKKHTVIYAATQPNPTPKLYVIDRDKVGVIKSYPLGQ